MVTKIDVHTRNVGCEVLSAYLIGIQARVYISKISDNLGKKYLSLSCGFWLRVVEFNLHNAFCELCKENTRAPILDGYVCKIY